LRGADEALSGPARTVDPQLVLEMCVVRLATLPPLLPVDDILQRLEALGGAEPLAASPPASRTAPAEQPGRLWEDFLARVRQEKVSLYMALAAGKLLSAEGEALRIGIENEAMRRELGRKDTLERLRAIAREVSGRDLRVEIGPVPSGHDTPLAQARRRTEEALADPLVQAAVDIFGAEVRGVRDRQRS